MHDSGAYGMPAGTDILAHLLALNQACAAREAPASPPPRPACPCPPTSSPPSSLRIVFGWIDDTND
ncbi:MAG: hypothetical protein KA152_14245 [Verrucomicrobiales bacterium]|nr:hypothetical protein [Verrucomicrobiales bacterium]